MPLVVNEEGVVDGLTQDQTVREHAGRILEILFWKELEKKQAIACEE